MQRQHYALRSCCPGVSIEVWIERHGCLSDCSECKNGHAVKTGTMVRVCAVLSCVVAAAAGDFLLQFDIALVVG